MICLYQRPDKVMVRVSSSNAADTKTYKPNDVLWGQRAGDLHEGVYSETGEFLGSFVDYWQGLPPHKPQRTGWWTKRLLGGR
jgi:hypothetical protein